MDTSKALSLARFSGHGTPPSLLSALWAYLPLPEWLPGAPETTWQTLTQALAQLWREVGHLGGKIQGSLSWVEDSPVWDPDLSATETAPPYLSWLFTPTPEKEVEQKGRLLIPLSSLDPLAEERFLLLLTPLFCGIIVQGYHPRTGQPGIMWSLDPDVLKRAVKALQFRFSTPNTDWDHLLQAYPLQPPHYRIVTRLGNLLLQMNPAIDPMTVGQLPAPDPSVVDDSRNVPKPTLPPIHSTGTQQNPAQPDDEGTLLRALMHEIRTPLATIRTLVQLLLRKEDLPASVRKHLERIDRECTEQINRFELFFQATETSPHYLQLTRTRLMDLVEQNLPRWREQVQRRGSSLDIELPQDLPEVVSDPKTLDVVLTGMIDLLARSSSPGSQIKAHFISAGEQVKLQFQLVSSESVTDPTPKGLMPLQAIGKLLMLQPDTGAVSLSIPVTQTLFRALGGYLKVKRTPQQGEVFTIYLPRQV
jgi:hypothetical protein